MNIWGIVTKSFIPLNIHYITSTRTKKTLGILNHFFYLVSFYFSLLETDFASLKTPNNAQLLYKIINIKNVSIDKNLNLPLMNKNIQRL